MADVLSRGVRACKALFYKALQTLTFCLGASNGVVFCGNGVVNGVVE